MAPREAGFGKPVADRCGPADPPGHRRSARSARSPPPMPR
jgi:hypothetical protein